MVARSIHELFPVSIFESHPKYVVEAPEYSLPYEPLHLISHFRFIYNLIGYQAITGRLLGALHHPPPPNDTGYRMCCPSSSCSVPTPV